MKKLWLTTIAMAFTVGTAFAVEANPLTGGGSLSYVDFVKSCQNPGSFGQQRPPENIRISCKNVERVWENVDAGAVKVPGIRTVSAEVFSDKYHVAMENFAVPMEELIVACPKLREIIQTSQIEKSLNCEQVIAETRSLEQVCVDAINEAVAQNADLVEKTPTGGTLSLCSSFIQK